jgi:hypothetical protein
MLYDYEIARMITEAKAYEELGIKDKYFITMRLNDVSKNLRDIAKELVDFSLEFGIAKALVTDFKDSLKEDQYSVYFTIQSVIKNLQLDWRGTNYYSFMFNYLYIRRTLARVLLLFFYYLKKISEKYNIPIPELKNIKTYNDISKIKYRKEFDQEEPVFRKFEYFITIFSKRLVNTVIFFIDSIEHTIKSFSGAFDSKSFSSEELEDIYTKKNIEANLNRIVNDANLKGKVSFSFNEIENPDMIDNEFKKITKIVDNKLYQIVTAPLVLYYRVKKYVA